MVVMVDVNKFLKPIKIEKKNFVHEITILLFLKCQTHGKR